MLGEGPMYEQMGREGADLFNQSTPDTLNSPDISGDMPGEQRDQADYDALREEAASQEVIDNEAIHENTAAESRKVVQVMLFFDDNTFITYKPSQ